MYSYRSPLVSLLLHRDLVDEIHDLMEQRRRRNREPRALHVMRVRRVVAAQLPEKRERVFVDDRVHFLGLEVLETRPAQVRVRPAAILADAVLPFRKEPPREGLAGPVGLVLLERLQIVQPLEEQKISDCSMTSSGLAKPPDQKAFQTWST
jgi:hypothetical protein